MGLLKVIEDAPGYCKATFQGTQGSGKTFTATKLACRIHKVFSSKKPIAFYDTEGGSDYVAHLIEEETGMKPLRVKTRAFGDLMEVGYECVKGASDIWLIDSITHVWREIQTAHMASVNEGRQYAKTRMDIQDIMRIKERWQPWPDFFLTSPIHIIVCGREGAAWGHEENEETGKRDLVQTGVKMKAEGEFGYEASLQVSMSVRQNQGGMFTRKQGKQTIKDTKPRELIQVATILKDRFDEMNGQVFEMPEGEAFDPFLKRLHPELHKGVNTAATTKMEKDPSGFDKAREEREILVEKIEAEMVRVAPGQTAAEKSLKLEMLERVFGTRSWTEISQRKHLPQLRDGVALLAKWTKAIASSLSEGVALKDAVEATRRVLDEPIVPEPPGAEDIGAPVPEAGSAAKTGKEKKQPATAGA